MNALICARGQFDDMLQDLRGVNRGNNRLVDWYLRSSILIRRFNCDSLREQVAGYHKGMHRRWAFTGRKDGTRGVHLAQSVSEKFGNLPRAERVGVLEN